MVPRAVGAAVGVRGAPGQPLLRALVAALAPRQLVLVLDNCEHLIGACARLVETLLSACPDVRILVTSREPLRVPGEIAWRVPPLAVPEPGTCSPEALGEVEAVALFVDRARARLPSFELTADNAPAVAEICRQLDGLPLGIELAAAQSGALAPEQIAARLDDALRLLGGGSRTLPRQETMRAALDWSQALLSAEEAALFRRLSVFAGDFDVEAVEDACSGDGVGRERVLGLLTALLDKSLVEPHVQPRVARYRLLEPVRQYGAALLSEAGESESIQRQHAEHYLRLADRATPSLMSGQRSEWLDRLSADQDNLRRALAWSRHQTEPAGVEIGLRLVGALLWYWSFRGEVSEGAEWTEALLARGHSASPAARAAALHTSGELCWLRGQSTVARTRLEESAALYRELGDERGLAYDLQVLPLLLDDQGVAADIAAEALRLFEQVGDEWGAAHAVMTAAILTLERGDEAQARSQLEASLARWRAVGDDWGSAELLNYLGDLARRQGREADAAECYQESLTLLRRQGILGTVPSLLHNMGHLALRAGDARRALRLFRQSLVLFRDQGDQRGTAECLVGLAGVLGVMKQPDRAARMLGATEAALEAIGSQLSPTNAADYARCLAVARAQMDERAFAAAWAAGKSLPLDRAVAEVLESESPSECDHALGLTAREREVAALLARGLTNRQIGEVLVISEGTARLHVKHVLHKLGFATRAQVAAWAVERGLGSAPQAGIDG